MLSRDLSAQHRHFAFFKKLGHKGLSFHTQTKTTQPLAPPRAPLVLPSFWSILRMRQLFLLSLCSFLARLSGRFLIRRCGSGRLGFGGGRRPGGRRDAVLRG